LFFLKKTLTFISLINSDYTIKQKKPTNLNFVVDISGKHQTTLPFISETCNNNPFRAAIQLDFFMKIYLFLF